MGRFGGPEERVRATIRIDQLGEAQGERLGSLRGYLTQHHTQPAGPPFVRYHTFGDTETDVELGIPVAEPVGGEGRIVAGELPGGPVATTWHIGAHDRLGDAYHRLEMWLNEHGHKAAGAAWEIYYWIDPSQDPASTPFPDPATWRTQLIQPIVPETG